MAFNNKSGEYTLGFCMADWEEIISSAGEETHDPLFDEPEDPDEEPYELEEEEPAEVQAQHGPIVPEGSLGGSTCWCPGCKCKD